MKFSLKLSFASVFLLLKQGMKCIFTESRMQPIQFISYSILILHRGFSSENPVTNPICNKYSVFADGLLCEVNAVAVEATHSVTSEQ